MNGIIKVVSTSNDSSDSSSNRDHHFINMKRKTPKRNQERKRYLPFKSSGKKATREKARYQAKHCRISVDEIIVLVNHFSKRIEKKKKEREIKIIRKTANLYLQKFQTVIPTL